MGVRSTATTGLFILACLYTLSVAREFLIPLAVGVMAPPLVARDPA